MQNSQIQTATGQIQEAFDQLQKSWAETREYWQDAQAIHFEETVLKKISEELVSTFPMLQHLSGTLEQARREVNEPS